MNKVFLIGRLTKDPEIRITGTGKKVASFVIAVNEGKDSSGQELVQFFNCTAWERLAEVVEKYVTKGTKVAVIGNLRNRSWDKPDGSKGYATDILVRELEILSGKTDATASKFEENQQSGSDDQANSQVGSAPAKETKPEEDVLPEIDVDQLNVQMPF